MKTDNDQNSSSSLAARLLPRRRVLGYMAPEFPGQTHIWMWREISLWREWGGTVQLLSTRPPSARDQARHEFARTATRQTVYLTPRPFTDVAMAVLWALLTRPIGFLRAARCALWLPVDRDARWWRTLPGACLLAREARRAGIRHVHSQSARNSAVLCLLAQRISGLSYSLVVNARLDEWGPGLDRKFDEAEFIVTHAAWLREEILHRFPNLGAPRVICAPVGVDMQACPPRNSYALAPERAFQLVSVGRLHANKGFQTLIRAVAGLVAAGRDVSLKIIGEGPERPALEQLIAELDLTQRVVLAGSQSAEAVMAELGRADAFALATREEALGVVFIEALAAGLPTVGTNVGGVGEIIRHEETGLLIPPDDPAALTAAVIRLIEDADLRERLGRRGRQWVAKRFDSRLGAARLFRRFWGVSPLQSDQPDNPPQDRT